MINNLQQTIINFCVSNIQEEIICFFLTALISFAGYKEELGDVKELWKIIFVASSLIWVILLIIYLVPLTIPSLKNVF